MLPYPLFQSRRILNVISTAKTFKCRPSDLLGIDENDVYGRYCIDEAATYLYNMMQPDKDGKTKKPTFIEDIKESKTKNPGLDLLLG
jgi:hypothetical protein